MNRFAYIAKNLEDKLECHSIDEIQYKVEHPPMLSTDPFNLPKTVQWIIAIAEKELKNTISLQVLQYSLLTA